MINDLPVFKIEKYTVAGLILNELQLTNRFWNLYKYLTTNHKPVSKETLYEFMSTIKDVTIVKIDQLKTMIDDNDFLDSISYDINKIKYFKRNHIVTRDWPHVRIKELHTKLINSRTREYIDSLVTLNANDQEAYPEIVKIKAKIEVNVLRMLAYAIKTNMPITPEIKEILSKYVLYFNPQRLAQKGICACMSIKFIRSILLENLHNNEIFANICKTTNETYNSTFNLAIKDEADLIFIYVMLMQKEINQNINLQEILYFIFEAISRKDYESISSLYVLSTAIEKAKIKHFDEYVNITDQTIISLVEAARKVFLSYDDADDEFEHLSFNCLRTLIFEDQRLDECKNDYQYFFSYVLFDHNLNKVRTKINEVSEDAYSAESSVYYKKIADCMSRLLTIYPYVELEHDFVDKLIENVCHIDDNETKRNDAKIDARRVFDYMDRQSCAVHKLATILSHTSTIPRDSTLEHFYIHHNDVEMIIELGLQYKKDVMNNIQSVLELYMTFVGFHPAKIKTYGIAIGELYIAMLNHICLDKLAKISSDIIIPYYMTMYPQPDDDSNGHAYVKYVCNGHIDILDPNFRISSIKQDMSIADINIIEDDPFEQETDVVYDHVKKSVIFYGGNDCPLWVCWVLSILVFIVIAVVIFVVMSYCTNDEEKFTNVPICFWHNY